MNGQFSSRTSGHQLGFTLIELMISLTLGLIISAAVIQIMISNSVTQKLNRAIASTQESGRYIISRMRNELLMTGMYDRLNPNLNASVDIVEEESFVRNHPIVLPGDFVGRAELGSIQGASGASDTLVIGLQNTQDCRGYKLGYLAEESFYTVNEYFVSNGKLKCRGFDGRVLRGQRIAVGHNNHAAFTLLDDVQSFQVTYGLADVTNNAGNSLPSQYVDASQLAQAFANGRQVVSVRMAILVKGEGDISLPQASQFTLLNEASITMPDTGLYKVFETTITLRNMKNFVRGQA